MVAAGQINWGLFLDLDLKKDDPNQLETIFSSLLSASIQADDAMATPKNLLHLFQVAQQGLKLRDRQLKDSEVLVKDQEDRLGFQETELKAYKAVQYGADSTVAMAEIRALNETIVELEVKNDNQKREIETLEKSIELEKRKNSQDSEALREEKEKRSKLEDMVSVMKQEVAEMKTQTVKRGATMIGGKAFEEEQLKNAIRDKNAEIDKYITEIKALTEGNAHFASEVESMAQELEATVAEIEKLTVELDEAQRLISKHDSVIDKLTDQNNTLKYQVDELSEQLNARGSHEDNLIDELHGELARQTKQARESSMALYDKTVSLEEMEREMNNMKEQIRQYDMDKIRKEILEKDELIDGLKEKLNEAYHDIELLSADWDNLDKLLQDQRNALTSETVKQHMIEMKKMQEKMTVYKEKRRQDLKKLQNVDTIIEDREKEILDLKKRVSDYETGVYGLETAVREIKDLRIQKNLRDKEIVELTKSINDYEKQAQEFIEENMELRRRLGLDETSAIDISNLKSKKLLDYEQTKSLNITLQKEIERLEEERLQLKSKIRLQAIERGERAVELGLTAEDLAAVEDYAEKLRHGDHSGPVSPTAANKPGFSISRPNVNNEQLSKLIIELERIHIESQESRDKLELTETERAKLRDENKALSECIREISTTLIRTRSGSSATEGSNPELFAFPNVAKLIKLLEKRDKMDKASDIRGGSAEENVLEINIILRDELTDTKSKLSKLTQNLDLVKKNLNQMTLDRNRWKERAEIPKKRVLHLPTELAYGTVHDFSSLVEQLVECLLDLQIKDKELMECRRSLENYHEKYADLFAKQNLLYREHNAQIEEMKQNVKQMEEKKSLSENARHLSEMQSKEFQNIIITLERGMDEVQRAYINSQRAVITLKTNEFNLVRRHSAMLEVETHLRKENSTLKADLRDLDKTARETISRLLRGKNEALFKVDSLLKKLDESVPAVQVAQLDNRLQSFISKTRVLLEREQEWISQKALIEMEVKEIKRLKDENDKLSLLYSQEKLSHEKLESAFDGLTSQFASGGPASKEQLTQSQRKISNLEVKLDIAHQRAELADRKCTLLEQVEAEIKERLNTVDKLYIDSMEEVMRLRESEIEIKNSFEGGASKEENAQNLKKIEELSKSASDLSNEVAKYKDLADIATQQASDLVRLQAVNDKEKKILLAAIQELQMEGDEKLLIGKMHHHIVALQVSEAAAMRKIEVLNSKCLKLESTVVQMEKMVDQRDNIIFQMHLDSKSRVRILQSTVSDLRSKMAGVVLLSKHERTCSLVQTLNESKTSLELELKNSAVERKKIEDKLALTLQNLESKEELLSALNNQNPGADFIKNWHKKMAECQLSELKIQRELMHLRESEMMAMKELHHTSKRASALEEELVALQSDSDAKQIDWERRELELEVKVQQYEEERERIFQAASVAELKEALPDRTLPIHHQLEVALRLLVERSRLLIAQEIRVAMLESNAEKYKLQISELESHTINKDFQIHSLKTSTLKIDESVKRSIGDLETEYQTKLRKREGEAIRTAQAMIASLRRQLTKKSDMVDKYQGMMMEMREKMAKQKEEEKKEIQLLTEEINNLSDKQVGILKKAHHSLNTSPSKISEVDYEKTIADLEKLVRIKEEEVVSLYDKIKSLDAEIQAEKQIKREQTVELEAIIEKKSQELHMQEENIVQLEAHVVELEETVAQRSKYNELEDTIVKLKRDVLKKEKQGQKQIKAIMELKKALLHPQKSSQSAMAAIMEPFSTNITSLNVSLDADSAAVFRMKEQTDKIMTLETKLDKLRQAADKYRNDASALEEKNRQLNATKNGILDDLAKKDKEMQQSSIDIVRTKQMCRELEKKLADLMSELEKTRTDRDSFKKKAEEKHMQRARSATLNSRESISKSNLVSRKGSVDMMMMHDTVNNDSNIISEVTVAIEQELKQYAEKELHLKSQLAAVTANLADKSMEMDNMKSQVKYLKSTLEQQRSELEVVIQQQDQTVKGVSGQNEKLAKDLELSKSQLKNLQAELEQEKKKQILASTTTIPSAPAATIVNEKRADLASPLTSTDSLAEEGSSNSATAKASVVDLNIYIQKITTLEEEVEKWKRTASLEKANELKSLERKYQLQIEKITMLEELNKELRSDPMNLGQHAADNALKGESSANMSQVWEARVRKLMEKNQAMEIQVLEVENKMAEFVYERDNAIKVVETMKLKVKESEEMIHQERIKMKETLEKGPAPLITGLTLPIPYAELRNILKNESGSDGVPKSKTKAQTDDLLRVIEHLSKNVNEQKEEIDNLRRVAPSNLKFMEIVKENKRLKKAYDEVDEQVKKHTSSAAQLERVEFENVKLQKQHRKDGDKIAKLNRDLQDIQVANETLKREIELLRRTISQIEVERSTSAPADATEANTQMNAANHSQCFREIKQLKQEVEEKEGVIQSLMNPEVNSTEKSNAECRRLTREVDMWKSRVGKLTVQVSELQMQATKQSLSTASRELDSRLQEVEGMNEQLRVEMDDIKYNYRQTLKQCIEYEDGIKRLCRVTGDRVSDFIKGSPSSRSSS